MLPTISITTLEYLCKHPFGRVAVGAVFEALPKGLLAVHPESVCGCMEESAK